MESLKPIDGAVSPGRRQPPPPFSTSPFAAGGRRSAPPACDRTSQPGPSSDSLTEAPHPKAAATTPLFWWRPRAELLCPGLPPLRPEHLGWTELSGRLFSPGQRRVGGFRGSAACFFPAWIPGSSRGSRPGSGIQNALFPDWTGSNGGALCPRRCNSGTLFPPHCFQTSTTLLRYPSASQPSLHPSIHSPVHLFIKPIKAPLH